MTDQSALVGYAILRANFDSTALSYLDNFQGFVLGALESAGSDYLEKSDIGTRIREDFGLSMSDLVVGNIARRTNRLRLTEPVGQSAIRLTPKGVEKAPAVRNQMARYQREQDELATQFAAFVLEGYPDREFDPSTAGLALANFLARHTVPIVGQGIGHGGSVATVEGQDFLASAFIVHLSKTDQVRFSYVVEAAKGAMLSTVLTLDTSSLHKSVDDLSVYLDTPVILDVLGFHGATRENAALDTVRLGVAQGLKIRVFEHTLEEVDGVLGAAVNSLRRPTSRSATAVYLHFAETELSPSDVEELRVSVPQSLASLGIEPRARPDGYWRYGLNEDELDAHLQERLKYQQEAARLLDLKSLSAIHRLRKDRTARDLQFATAILVTSNSGLVGAARRYRENSTFVPLAITDESLAAWLWVRSAAVDAATPQHVLLAAAYSAMQPDSRLWTRYLEEIQSLEQRGDISAEKAMLLRSRTSAEALMRETLGDPDVVSEESTRSVIARVEDDIAGPLQAQIQDLESEKAAAQASADAAAETWLANTGTFDRVKKENEALRDEVDRLSQESAARESGLEREAGRRARRSVFLLRCFIGVGAVGVAVLLVVLLTTLVGPPLAWLSACVTVVGLILPLVLPQVPWKRLEELRHQRLLKALRRGVGLPETSEPAAESKGNSVSGTNQV